MRRQWTWTTSHTSGILWLNSPVVSFLVIRPGYNGNRPSLLFDLSSGTRRAPLGISPHQETKSKNYLALHPGQRKPTGCSFSAGKISPFNYSGWPWSGIEGAPWGISLHRENQPNYWVCSFRATSGIWRKSRFESGLTLRQPAVLTYGPHCLQ